VANMAVARRFHTATLLKVPGNPTLNNKVLVVGGNFGINSSLTSVQVFDGTSAWTTLTPLATAREGQTATVLANGKVLIAGGKSMGIPVATALLFDPASGTGTWTAAGTMTSARQGHTATLLPPTIVSNGQVLAAGGTDAAGVVLSSAELFDGVATWRPTTALAGPMQGHAATLLPNNRVLLAG